MTRFGGRALVLVLTGLCVPAPVPVRGQALDATAELMRELTEAPGPSGFEEAVREIVVDAYRALGASIEYDGLGSVIATLPDAPDGPRVMVTAHMDEVGLMVQHVTPDGFLLVKNLGGWLDHAFPDHSLQPNSASACFQSTQKREASSTWSITSSGSVRSLVANGSWVKPPPGRLRAITTSCVAPGTDESRS